MRARFPGLLPGLLSGLLFALAFPFVLPGDPTVAADPAGWLEFLSFAALVPLLLSVAGAPLRQVFLRGLFAGAVAFGLSITWVEIALVRFGGLSLAAALPVVAALVIYCAATWGLAVWAACLLRRWLGLSLAAGLPLAWVSAELLRNFAFTGFPWCSLGQALSRTPSLTQIVSLGGVSLVAALLAGVNGAIAEGLLHRQRHRTAISGPRVFRGLAGAGLALVSAALFSFFWRAHLDRAMAVAPRISVAIVQGNIDQRIINRGAARRAFVLGAYLPLTEQAVREGAELVVWPEAAWPGSFHESGPHFRLRPQLARLRGMGRAHYLLTGTTRHERARGPRRTNDAWLLGPDLEVLATHRKTHLVPFGEWVPFESLLPLRQLVPGLGSFIPGEALAPLAFTSAREAGPQVRLGETICYEGIFPEIARALTRGGANLLVNSSNDAWYGASAAPHHFLQIVTLRAIENGRVLLRAANTGISAIVSPTGEVLERSELGLVDAPGGVIAARSKRPPVLLQAQVPLLEVQTLYGLTGDLFAFVCLGLLGFGLAAGGRRAARMARSRKRNDDVL